MKWKGEGNEEKNRMFIHGNDYSNELKTDEKPYGWKLILESDYSEKKAAIREQDMESFACVMLGMIEKLDEVTFIYHTEGKYTEKTISTEQASELFGQDIKECLNSIDVLEELLEKTGLDHYANMAHNTAYSPLMNNQIIVTVINSTKEQIQSVYPFIDLYDYILFYNAGDTEYKIEFEFDDSDILTMVRVSEV